jgi:hypothetical protein
MLSFASRKLLEGFMTVRSALTKAVLMAVAVAFVSPVEAKPKAFIAKTIKKQKSESAPAPKVAVKPSKASSK